VDRVALLLTQRAIDCEPLGKVSVGVRVLNKATRFPCAFGLLFVLLNVRATKEWTRKMSLIENVRLIPCRVLRHRDVPRRSLRSRTQEQNISAQPSLRSVCFPVSIWERSARRDTSVNGCYIQTDPLVRQEAGEIQPAKVRPR
jgi:hypothetical protein